jgi:ATP-binding cassette, subfamily B, multidrug efflux pump
MFLLAIFFLSIEALCDLLQPTIMSKIVDIGIKNHDLHFVLQTGGLMLLITAVGATGAVIRNNISSRVSQRFGTELRYDLFSKIQNLSYENAGRFETASLVTNLTNDVTQVQNFVNGMMRFFVKAPLLGIGSIIMSIILDPKLSLIIAVIIPIVIFIIYLNNKIGYPFFRKVQSAIDNLNGVMREYLSGIRVIKAFNRFDYERLTNAQISSMRVTSLFSPLTMMTINFGVVGVLWFGGFSVNNGDIEVGKIIALTNYMAQMSSSLMMISTVFTMFVRARASGERIGGVMNTNDRIQKRVKPVKTSSQTGIEFNDVSFSYPGNPNEFVLKHINFLCKAGTTLGIIGTTGSGKTSIINLIPRFYDAAKGSVIVNGNDVQDMDEHDLRDEIAVVPQKNMLFTGSILDNIRWGNEKASIEEVVYAAKIAEVHEFIQFLPEGYNTILGQGGVNLSGGQKQRIAIARALLKNPKILILDDCTSAVDLITESNIQKGLRKYSSDMICIIIAQRISSVIGADSILVIDNGEIAGNGNHLELMENCPIYQEIYDSQFKKEDMLCQI